MGYEGFGSIIRLPKNMKRTRKCERGFLTEYGPIWGDLATRTRSGINSSSGTQCSVGAMLFVRSVRVSLGHFQCQLVL